MCQLRNSCKPFRSEQQQSPLLNQRLEETLNSLNVRLKPLGISLCKSFEDVQGLLKPVRAAANRF